MHIPPVIFADGSEFYAKFAKKYKTHSKGLFILAPSGAGKTHFCKSQAEPHWIDGDDLWHGAKAHPDGPWWTEPVAVINSIDMRCDILTHEAMERGFWIMGASNYWLPQARLLFRRGKLINHTLRTARPIITMAARPPAISSKYSDT